MPANLARDAVSLNGRMVLLRARTSIYQGRDGQRTLTKLIESRKTFKAVFGAPTIVPAPSALNVESEPRTASTGYEKRRLDGSGPVDDEDIEQAGTDMAGSAKKTKM